MKRTVIALLLACVLAAALAGCGSSPEGAPPPAPASAAPAATPEPTPEPAPEPTPAPTPAPDPLLSAVSVDLLGKDILPEDRDAWRFSDYVMFDFNYTNHTDKEIRGFQGIVSFYDMFGKEILSLSLENTDPIEAGATINNSDMSLEVNPYIDDHVKLRDTKFEDMTMSFVPTMVVFSDGTTLGE